MEWEPLPGTRSQWRVLRVRRHWAQVNPDGSWTISTGRGKYVIRNARTGEQRKVTRPDDRAAVREAGS